MCSIGIVISPRAFFPEARAYQLFLERLPPLTCKTYTSINEAAAASDILILFLGALPFWKRPDCLIVAEYHSLSTGKFPRIKNAIKRIFNVRGDLYVFLNERVRRDLHFPKSVNHVLRGMGFDWGLRGRYIGAQKAFDFVYCGSINRPGVIQNISRIAAMGFTFAVVGNTPEEAAELEQRSTSITCFGKLPHEACYQVIASARYGLNYTPPIYPLNVQDSTKVMEYAALGLGVVTNSYRWIDEFEQKTAARFLRIEHMANRGDVDNFAFSSGTVNEFSWDNILAQSRLGEAIIELCAAPRRRRLGIFGTIKHRIRGAIRRTR